ncbi:winged helix-turn-helix domain-containing protein [Haloferax sp. S1W]|uniref:winged helix-turn-helix domain-containing protein n=1 Tax=Haloferax sp. S1W TaxID=3377110 RepID=UPI0037C704FC
MTGSPLEGVSDTVGPRATEAFATLGHETRLAILLILWDAFEPWSEENAMSFAELRKRAGLRDGSQFNYHLKQLVGHLVRKTEDGYELRRAGHQLVRTVIAGAGIEDPSFEATEVDENCRLCGAPTEVIYHDEELFQICTECDGFFGGPESSFPDGMLRGVKFDPAGVTNRNPEEVLDAAQIQDDWRLLTAIEGVCDACSGPINGWLHVCEAHTADGVCPTCHRRSRVKARFQCAVCKQHGQMSPRWLTLFHPAVVAFLHERDIPLAYDPEGIKTRLSLHVDPPPQFSDELVDEDPPRVHVTVECEGDELRLTMDEELNIVDVVESG